jgi:hypothetical protein
MRCLADGVMQQLSDSELTDVERSEVERHLSQCDRCRARLQEMKNSVAMARAGLEKLNPALVEIPQWTITPIEVDRSRFSSESGFQVCEKRVTWLQGLVTVAAAAALWFVFFPVDHRPLPTDSSISRLMAQLPPVAEDPQRMWREQCVVITVVDKVTGSVERIITSSTSDRVVRESFQPVHSSIDDSSEQRKGI